MNEKPKILSDAITKQDSFYDEFHKRNVRRVRDVSRVKFARVTVGISRFIDDSRTRLDCSGTINDIENAFWELCDFSYVWESERELWKDVKDDAHAILAYVCPDMPARVAYKYDDSLKADAMRAIESAKHDDYCAQFNKWFIDNLEDAIYAAMPKGAVWAWCDKSGNPTTEYYECDSVVVAMPRKSARDATNEIWDNYLGDCETQHEREENATNAIREFIADSDASKVRPEFFDERGYRYADHGSWAAQMIEYMETDEEWREDIRKMRKKLRTMIASRAPLESRAALVATVFGEP